MLQRPNENEFPDYYVPYVNLVSEGNLLEILKEDLKATVKLFEGMDEEVAVSRYENNKWSIKEVLGHMSDTERVMSYRLLRIGRGDQTPLAGFNENDFVEASQCHHLPLQTILEDFIATRKATITLVQNMPGEAWDKKGFANNLEISTRAIAYIIAGHERHHRNIIEQRYLSVLE